GLMWEEEHHTTLKATGWTQCEGEPCLFKRIFDGVECYLCTYVDNLFLGFPPGSEHRQKVFDELGSYYELNDLGTVKFTLGAKIFQQPRLQTI
ncbi:hypothetical protein INO08_15360, partial [Staphylococcus aureus]|nr:hypothetical protein [Staphylococcus aureus]